MKNNPEATMQLSHKGPHPGGVAIVSASLFILSLIIPALLTGGAPYPSPYGPQEASQAYYLQYPLALRISAFLQFGSAIPLSIFTAAMVSRLRFLGVRVTGVDIAQFGGFMAAAFLALSALGSWVQSQPGVADTLSTMRAVQLFGFISGGMAHVVLLGLLLAGISVPSLIGRFLPRGLCITGLVIAAVAVLSSLVLLLPAATYLLPLARFSALIWMIVAGFRMRKSNSLNT